MSSSAIQEILEEIEELLASAGDLASEVELAVEKLLNVVEAPAIPGDTQMCSKPDENTSNH